MGTISRVTTWSTGDTLTAADLNGEFDNILSTANGSLNADNLGVTAGIASALKAVVLDANKDFADGTGSNQIRNLTISGSLAIGTTFLPDASGGADLGSSSLEWGDLYIADDKYINLGSDQNILIGYDETTTDSLKIAATEGAGLAITLMADEGDDAGDEWKLNVADGGTITLGNDIASAGTYVTHLTLTPHATVSSSTLALAGALTVAGTAGITGVATVGGLTIGSAVINEAELETIDGVTAGTVAASKAVVVDSNLDIASFRNVTLTGELDAATGDFSGDVDVDGTLEADAITLGGTALGSLYSPIAGSSSIVTVGTVGTGTWQGTAVALGYGGTGLVGATDGKIVIADGSGAPVLLDVGSSTAITVLGTVATGTWQGTAVASAYLDADTAHLTTTQTFSGAKTFSAAAQFSNTVTVGVNDTGYDVQFFGATSGSSVLWDQSEDDLILTNAGLAVGSDATGDVYYRDANGFLARLGASTDGHVLTTGGAGTIPAWEAAPGAGSGSFSGPGSATDNAVVRFNGTGGATGQNSGLIVDDSNNVTGAANVTLSGELDAATGDFSGDVDVDGTLEADAITIGGTALLANDTNNRVTTATGSGTLNGEAYLTFDGSTLNVVGNAGVGIARTDGTLHVHTATAGSVAAPAGADELVVENSASGGISILTPDANGASLNFGSPSDNDYASIWTLYDSPGPQMNLDVVGTKMTITSAGLVGINETANANMTQGLTIDQNANDNEILALKSSDDVAHGVTDLQETDTYLAVKKAAATQGGVKITAITAGNNATNFVSVATSVDTAKTTSGFGIMALNVSLKSGTGAGAVSTDGNLVSISNNGTARFLFDAEGTGHADVDWVSFSDSRLKTNVIDCPYGLAEVLQLRPKAFDKHSGKIEDGEAVLEEHARRMIGFLAQDVKALMPELVKDVDTTESFYSLNDGKLAAVLVNAIKELNDKLEAN